MTRPRLTAADWLAIYDALMVLNQPHPRMRRVLGKIGVHGMAARDRGVAPVRKAKR